MLRYLNDGVITVKPRYQTTRNAHMIWPHESSFTLHQEEFKFGEHTRKAKIPNDWSQE
jgi:hypothetical protein